MTDIFNFTTGKKVNGKKEVFLTKKCTPFPYNPFEWKAYFFLTKHKLLQKRRVQEETKVKKKILQVTKSTDTS